MTIDLPEDLANRLSALMPEADRTRFAVGAIADAVGAREQDTAECVSAVEEAFLDIEMHRTISLDEERTRWDQQKAGLLTNAGGPAS